MRALLPRPVDDVDVHEFYGDGWLAGGGLRVNFVASVDGAAHASGTSRGLQTPGDNVVFAALRDLADVVLAGSGTMTAEGYQAVHPDDATRQRRRDLGVPATLTLAVSSRSLHLDPASRLFLGAEPDARTIVLTCDSADRDRRAALEKVADVVSCGEDTVEPALARRALEDRGLTRILSEGGPTVFTDLVRGGVVDELCLSQSPLLVGPGAGRIVAGDDEWGSPSDLTLTGLLEDDGALFLRYRLTG